MLYKEIIAVCSLIHTKYTNNVCGHNVEFVSVNLVVKIVTTGLEGGLVGLPGEVRQIKIKILVWFSENTQCS